jgi:hypothetical protein
LQDTLRRLQQEDKSQGNEADSDTTTTTNNNTTNSDNATSFSKDDLLRKAADAWSSFTTEVALAWNELVQSGQRKDINKKIHPEFRPENDRPYEGPVDILVIDPAEHLSAWERMQRRLTEAPIIQTILNKTHVVYEKSGAKQVKEKMDHLTEDAREVWETSQHPWVYRVSSVYDTLTAEAPESAALKELRKLDPTFTYEEWQRDVVEHSLPQIMSWLLEGKIGQLQPWLGEGVFRRMAAEITARQKEGVQIDTHVLGIMNSEILAVEVSDTQCCLCDICESATMDLTDTLLLLAVCYVARHGRKRIAHYLVAFHGTTNQLRQE